MIICVAGKNNIAVNAVEYLINELSIDKTNIILVPNKNDNGQDSWQKSLKKYAMNNDITIKELPDVYKNEDMLFISLEFDQIIKTEKFKTKKLFNIHFSLLPSYKGMYTSAMPIINGEKKSGVTLHKIDNGIDTGDIIDQIEFDIDLIDTSRDLYFKYLEFGFCLFKKNIKKLIEDNFTTKPQSCINSSYYSKKAIDYSNLSVDLNKTSYEIYNQIRAFIFKEYQLPSINNMQIKKVELTSEKIGYKQIETQGKTLILSGIDGYIIKAYCN